ncbi:MAG: hypothetical protein BroJett029_35670 [Alphaproteobacteria bacterium]|nr:MAG: hypothetical protein BroJett029_35670 [Alphaproteobacteria bacterium]
MSRSYGHTSSAPLRTGGQINVLSLIGAAFALILETPLTWLQRDRDRRALQSLDDRLLRDIGVSRGQVEDEVSKPFWRP